MTRTENVPPLIAPRHDHSDGSTDADLLAGRYRLDEVLGRGGMAVVHKATDLVLHRPVAVKVFRSEGNSADASRYEHEARILAGLNSSGLVTVYDAGVDASDGVVKPFVVMEYVPGATLADVIRDGPLDSAEVARLGAEIATALAYVHRHGVVHRDVKPANILLPAVEDGAPAGHMDAKLADFGISRLVSGGAITTTNHRLGTVAYLSPEQVRGDAVGPQGDVYSLGLVLAECLTGEKVFDGEGVDAAAARLHEPPQLPPTLPAEWGRLLRDMLDLEPERRPTAAEVSVALAGLIMTVGAVPSPAQPVEHAQTAPEDPTTAIPQVAAVPAALPTHAHVGEDVDTGPHATKVLNIPPELLAPRRRVRPSWAPAWTTPWKFAAAAAAVLFMFVVIALAAPPIQTPPHVRPPAYPSVPGKLGTDLTTLQKQVQQ